MKTIAAVLASGVIGLSSAVVSASSLPVNLSPPSEPVVTTQRLDAWEQLITRLRSVSEAEQIKAVNQFFNSLRFRSDQTVWGMEDYWASPSEFLKRGTGDCEDYAIAKYITLRRLGFDDSRLRLAYVRSLTLRQAHMVLLVDAGQGKRVVLDNLTSAIQSPTRRGDLEPVYSFNSTGLWLLSQEYGEQRIGQASRLNHWVSLQEKSKNPSIWPPG